MLQALCPLCRQGLLIPLEMAGQAMRCPHCSGAFQAPSAEAIQQSGQAYPGSPSPAPTQPQPTSQWQPTAAEAVSGGASAPADELALQPLAPQSSAAAIQANAFGSTSGGTTPSHAKSLGSTKTTDSTPWEMVKIVGGGMLGLGLGWIIVVQVILPLQQGPSRPTKVAQQTTTVMPQPSPAVSQPTSPPTTIPPVENRLPPETSSNPPTNQSPPPSIPPATLPPTQFPPSQIPPTQSPTANSPPASLPSQPVAPPPPAASSPPSTSSEPSPPPNSEPSPPTTGNPFERLPGVFKLPSPVATAAQTIATFARALTEPLEIQIDSTLADVAEAATFVATKAENSESTWHVHYVADTRSENTERRKLGQFELVERELRYVWDQVNEEFPWKQLANCQIALISGEHRHSAQLREPKKEAAFELDLDKAKDIRKVSVGAMPKSQRLQLSIEQLVNFPQGAQIKGDKRVVQIGQEAAIEFTTLPGAFVEIKFAKQPDESLALMVTPVFKEKGSDDIPLTNKRLQDMADAADKWLRDAASAIPALEREFRSLQNQLQSAKSDARSAEGTPAAVGAARAVGSLTTKLDACGRKLKRMNQQVPEMKARQAAVPKVKALMDSLHGKARLELKIAAAKPDGNALALVELTAGQ